MASGGNEQEYVVIKSFKYDGHLHRTWFENWPVPEESLHPLLRRERFRVFINHGTKIREADGKIWTSRVPGVSYFAPGKWFNAVALLESTGVRYYCNIASPFTAYDNTVTYIDYDLDVILMQNGEIHVVDEEEFEAHRLLYRYPPGVVRNVRAGLKELIRRMRERRAPFLAGESQRYYELWRRRRWTTKGNDG